MTFDEANTVFEAKPTRPTFCDMEGMVFARLTVLGYVGRRGNTSFWLCRCECGTVKAIARSSLVGNQSRSCGCLRREKGRASLMGRGTHYQSYSSTYKIWIGLRSRCNNPNSTAYSRYGGRGIQVCDRWNHSFENFYADMGERPQRLSLERIDNNKDYSPENCKWATRSEQCNNTSHCVFYTMNGRTQTMAQWAREYRLEYNKVFRRLRELGWTIEQALFTPFDHY